MASRPAWMLVWFNDGRIPLLFEALPTEASANQDRRDFHVDLLRPLRTMGIQAINVPEIIGGHYETVPPTEFAAALQQATGLPAMVNRITTQEPADGLTRWISNAKRNGIDHYVLVGGDSSKETYPGPSVTAALRHAKPHAAGTLGCITIPTRRRPLLDEPERLMQKAQAGADHAISQILGESVSASTLQRDTARHAATLGEPCIPLFWSLAPIARKKDIKFLKWLGVEIPAAYEKTLNAAGRGGRLKVSHATNEAMARNLLEHAEAEAHGPIGFCIEHVMRSNMAPAFELVERISDVVREFKAAPLTA